MQVSCRTLYRKLQRPNIDRWNLRRRFLRRARGAFWISALPGPRLSPCIFREKYLLRFSVFHLYNFFQFCANASKQTFVFAGINRVASNQTFVCTIKLNSSWKTLMCLRGYFASVLFRLLPLFESLKSTRGLLVAKLLARVYCTGGSKSSLFLSVHS